MRRNFSARNFFNLYIDKINVDILRLGSRVFRVRVYRLGKYVYIIKYKTSETPKIDNIFIYLRFDYISVIIRIN